MTDQGPGSGWSVWGGHGRHGAITGHGKGDTRAAGGRRGGDACGQDQKEGDLHRHRQECELITFAPHN